MKTYIHDFDTHIMRRVRTWPSRLHGLMFFVSYIGQPAYTIALLLIVGAWGLAQPHTHLLGAALLAGVTFALNSLLKLLFRRARPAHIYRETMPLDTYSFPSGHSASAAVIFGLVAYIVWHTLMQPWAILLSGFLVLLIVAIGISRVYLGAHYPSDVLAGWTVGFIGLAGIILYVRPLI